MDMEYQSEQDCVTEIKNLLCSNAMVQNLSVKCYAQNAETSCKDIIIVDFEFVPQYMLKCLKVEMFTIQIFTTIHRAQDISWTTDNFQLCCMSDHCSEISGQI